MSEIQVGQINSTDGSTAITTGAGGTVTLSAALTGTDATLSGGVYLGGSGAANKLDDYEEGEYEPTVTASSGTITVDGTNKIATYTKIGDLVTAHGRIDIASVSSPTGRIGVSLPFATASGSGRATDGAASVFIWSPSSGQTALFVAFFNEGSSTMEITYGDSTGPTTGAEKMQAGSEIRFSITYRTA